VLSTHYHQRNILKQPVDRKCRMCCKSEEHVKHIVAGCTTLAPSEYTSRLNKMAGYIHWTVGKHMELQVTDYYKHVTERVINVSGITIIWDLLVITDQIIPANRPDKVPHDKKEKICLLINIAIRNDSNVNTQETEKLSKFKDLEVEVSRMWNVRTKIVPVIIGALGTIKKGFD